MSIETVAAPEKMTAKPAAKPVRQQNSTLFRVIWRWHFFAGLIVSPLILVIALTGAIYIFAAEISDIANRELMYVSEVGEERPFAEIITNAAAVVPEGRVTRVATFHVASRTMMVSVSPAKKEEQSEPSSGRRGRKDEVTVAVNPYSAEVQGHSNDGKKLGAFFRVVLKIHRSLFIGSTGRIIVEIATCWMIILFLTGAFLWWPRRKEKMKGVWIPRWKAKPYVLLRDLHALAGVYLLPICLTIMVTGLFYTLVWGKGFYLATDPLFASKAAAAEEAAPETVESKEDEEKQESYIPPELSLQQAFTIARDAYPGRDVSITLPSKSEDHYEVSAINDWARGTYGAMDSTGFQVHRTTGEILNVDDLWHNDRYWWHTWAYPLHVGSVVGPFSKLLWLLACGVLIALPFTGLWMWWKRKPAGKSGFPKRYSYAGVPIWIWSSIVVLSLLLPMFGLSVVAVILLDLLSRPLRRRFASAV